MQETEKKSDKGGIKKKYPIHKVELRLNQLKGEAQHLTWTMAWRR